MFRLRDFEYSHSQSLSQSLFANLSFLISLNLSLSLFLNLSEPLSLNLSLNLCLYFDLSLNLYFDFIVNLFLFLCLFLSLSTYSMAYVWHSMALGGYRVRLRILSSATWCPKS